jgi:hypothetical protein
VWVNVGGRVRGTQSVHRERERRREGERGRVVS